MIGFDSSALLAYVRDEPGADLVGDLLDDADIEMFVHAANLCEMFHGLLRYEGRVIAEESLRDFLSLGVQVRSDMDEEFWRDAAELIARQRLAGVGLPLGDALGVALARRLDAEFVTSDRGEIEPLERAGLCRVIFIR